MGREKTIGLRKKGRGRVAAVERENARRRAGHTASGGKEHHPENLLSQTYS